MDKNLTDRIAKFQKQLKNEYVYRIPLKLLCRIGLVNQCFRFNTKFVLTLETDMQKLFETNTNQSTDALPTSIDADIVFTGVRHIMCEQFQLDDNFKTYLEGTIQSEHVLRTRIKRAPYQESFELVRGIESRVVDFTGANKQSCFSAVSLVYDKSNQHRSIYDSYNVELASTKLSHSLSKMPLTHTVHLIA